MHRRFLGKFPEIRNVRGSQISLRISGNLGQGQGGVCGGAVRDTPCGDDLAEIEALRHELDFDVLNVGWEETLTDGCALRARRCAP